MTDNQKFVEQACKITDTKYDAKEIAKTLAAGYTVLQTANAFCGRKLSKGDVRVIEAMIK